MRKLLNKNAFTMIEMMMAVGFSVLLLTGVYGFYNAASQSYSSGISSQILQDGANIVISKIMEGQWEAQTSAVYRVSTSAAYYIPNNLSNILYFCQDNPLEDPCTPTERSVRSYTVDASNQHVLYYHPTSNPLGYDIIYTAPAGSTLNVRFSPAQQPNPTPPPAYTTIPNVIEIDVALLQNLSSTGATNKRTSTTSGSGAATTFVLLRNHP